MNWGNKITVVLILFVTGMGYMVYVCMKQTDIQLVTKDYYEQEVNYQQVIDKKNNYSGLTQKPQLVEDLHSGNYLLDFSRLENHGLVKGSLVFFRPSQSHSDTKIDIQLDKDGKQWIDKSQFMAGKWIVKLDWKDESSEYFNEQVLWVQ